MSSVKSQLLQMLEEINDEAILKTLIEDLIFYTTQKDVLDVLKQDQAREAEEESTEGNGVGNGEL